MVSKKAQGISITTIVVIIIGLVVLVLLILGFTQGWKNLLPWVAPSNNVKTIADQCNLACNLNQKYEFCSVGRDLKSETEELEATSCYILAEERVPYGIEKCSAIDCVIYDDLDFAKDACSEADEEISYIDNLKIGVYTCLERDIIVSE